MKKRKVKGVNKSLSFLLYALFGVTFLLIIYLARMTDKLIKVQAANAEASKQTNLPLAPANGASCGT